jgi:hypothetical protein
MKKYIYLVVLLLSVGFFSSCSDLLDEKAQSQVDKNKFMNSASEAETVLLGVYRSMVSDNLYGYNLSLLFPLSTDIAQCEGSSTSSFRQIPTNAFTTSNSSVQGTWEDLYTGIYDANDFLETIATRYDSFSATDKQLATIYMAEARTLRALYYFELLRWYGNIVLMTSTEQSYLQPSTFVQAAPDSVFKYIESDLKFAIENLPYASDDNIRSDNSFRISRGAALGLLTKVYATWAGYPVHDTSKWENAAQTAKILIDSGKHSLLPNYQTLWENTCNSVWNPAESLIEVSFYAPTVTGTASEDPCGRIGKWNGVVADMIAGTRGRNAGNVKVVYTFYRDWTNGDLDLRRDLSVANYKYVGTTKTLLSTKTPDTDSKNWQIMTPAKWDTEKYVKAANVLIDNDKSNINWYILRYSDVLLLYAEALNEWKGGPTDEAYEAVNMVRRRGFGYPVTTSNATSDLAAGMSQETFRNAVRQERAYELAFEGHRRQDLVRWGIYYETVKATGQALVDWYSSANYAAVQYTMKNKHELFPIPQRECDIMPNIKQNIGWY